MKCWWGYRAVEPPSTADRVWNSITILRKSPVALYKPKQNLPYDTAISILDISPGHMKNIYPQQDLYSKFVVA